MNPKERVLIVPSQYPYVEFGGEVKRQIRMPVCPEISGDEGIRIVTATLPAGSISEGHTHPDADEYIMFDIPGKAVVDGVEYDVPANGVIHARKNKMHECINTDPERTLTLYCVFTPAFAPYGKYPELIEKNKEFINESEAI